MLLEEAAADHDEHRARRRLDQDGDTLVELVRLLRVGHRLREDLLEVRERVLVHRVDRAEVGHHEVQNGAARRHRSVGLLRDLDLGGGLLGALDRLGRLGGDDLGVVEGVDQVLVVEDVARARREQMEDLVLELLVRARARVRVRVKVRVRVRARARVRVKEQGLD